MTKDGFTTVQRIMDDLADQPLMDELTIDNVVRYVARFIARFGLPQVYLDAEAYVGIDEWHGLLPCDFVRLVQVMAIHEGTAYAMHSSTSTFAPREIFTGGDRLTYRVRGRFIHTSFKEGKVHVSYKAMPVDDDGMPMLPDDEMFISALESYIVREWYFGLFSKGRIPQNVYAEAKQRYAFEAAMSFERMSRPTADAMENIGNIINAIAPHRRPDMAAYSGISNHDEYRRH